MNAWYGVLLWVFGLLAGFGLGYLQGYRRAQARYSIRWVPPEPHKRPKTPR